MSPFPPSWDLIKPTRTKVDRTAAVRNATTLPPSPSRFKVFQTPELFENILVHLPLEDLFAIQRVSHKLRNAIQQSPSIKSKLFLRATSKTQRWKFVKDLDGSNTDLVYADEGERENEVYTPARLNPLFGTLRIRKHNTDDIINPQSQPQRHCVERISSRHILPFLLRQNISCGHQDVASWEAMLVCDPPPSEVKILYGSIREKISVLVYNPRGVSLGTLARAMQKAEGVCTAVSFWGAAFSDQTGGASRLSGVCQLEIPGFLIPTEEEWQDDSAANSTKEGELEH